MTSKLRSAECFGMSLEDTCLLSMWCLMQRRRDSHLGRRMELGNLVAVPRTTHKRKIFKAGI